MVIGLLSLGALGLRTGLDNQHQVVGTPESLAGQRLLAAHFPAGESQPVQVVVNSPTADQAATALRTVRGVAALKPAQRSSDGRLTMLSAVLSAPDGSKEAQATVTRIRTLTSHLPGADAIVGGSTALGMDKASAQAHDRTLVIPLALGAVLLILVLVLRSLVAPLLLMGTVILSYAATLGLSWHLFRNVLGFPALDVQVALFGFIFLVALGVDYNIFLVSRIREETRQYGHERGVLQGLGATGAVITSAGAVLAATFAILATAPQVAFIEIGVFVATGVLLDTLVVRTLLVPALALDVGPAFWWPGRPTTPRPHDSAPGSTRSNA